MKSPERNYRDKVFGRKHRAISVLINAPFRVNAQGKFLTDVSLYDLQKGDVDQAVVLEKEVKVDDGLLNLEFMVLPTAPGQKEANGTERFLNAVEVIPVH